MTAGSRIMSRARLAPLACYRVLQLDRDNGKWWWPIVRATSVQDALERGRAVFPDRESITAELHHRPGVHKGDAE